MNNLPRHLGGHGNICHIDQGILNYFIETYNITSFLDIGCGTGKMVEMAQNRGLNAVGVDGDFTIERNCNCYIHDYTQGPLYLKATYDLCWSVEFLEHVEEKYIQNFMETFKSARYVALTFSKKPADRHFNLQNHDYWKNVFDGFGFSYDKEMSLLLKEISTMKREFFQDTGSFFINRNKDLF